MTGFPGIGAALVDRLSVDAGIIALGVSEKIFPNVLPQNEAVPAIVYEVVSDLPYDDVEGRASLYRAIINYQALSTDSDEVNQIEDALRVALRGYRGENLSVKIRGIHHLQSTDDFEGEVLEHVKIVRFGVFYRREDPDIDESDS